MNIEVEHMAAASRDSLTRPRCVQIVNQKGKLQKINVMVCTYNEDMETVEKCVQHLLDSPEPVYCSKHIYIGDDGAKKKFGVLGAEAPDVRATSTRVRPCSAAVRVRDQCSAQR